MRWAVANAVSSVTAVLANISLRVDGLYSTLKINRVRRSTFPTCRSQALTRPRLVLVKGLSDRKIVQISTGPQHSLTVDSNGCVLRPIPFPFTSHADSIRLEPAFTRVAGMFSSGVVRATAVSASETNKTPSSRSLCPPSQASGKSPAAHPSMPARRAVRSLTGAGCTGLRASGRYRATGVLGSRGAVSDSCRILCE